MLQKFVSAQVQRVMVGALAAAALAAPASAATVVFKNTQAQWMNASSGTWRNITDLDYRDNPGDDAAVYWGDPDGRRAPQSGYKFESYSVGGINLGAAPDEAGPFKLGKFTHYNEPITGTSLASIDLRYTTDIFVDGENRGTYSFDWTFSHHETSNSGRCPYNPTRGINSNGCADRVQVGFQSTNNSFQIDDYIYTFNLAGFQQYDGGWAEQEYFYTKEDKKNSAYLLGTLSVKDAPMANIPAVPEPATWAMLIMGFGGIGSVMRRQRRAALAAA